MAFDFKKEYKEFYMPKNKPEIVTVPKANYIVMALHSGTSRKMKCPYCGNKSYHKKVLTK